jgi:hypothetical protein
VAKAKEICLAAGRAIASVIEARATLRA